MAASTQLSSFSAIPEEIFLKILAFCDALEIIRSSQTCRSFHGLIQASPLLQYQVELDIAGLCDHTLSSHPVNFEKLHDFCTRRDSQKAHVENASIGSPSRSYRFPEGNLRTQCIGDAFARSSLMNIGLAKLTLTSLSTFESWTWDKPLETRYRRFRICPKMNVFVGVRMVNESPLGSIKAIGPIYLDVFELTTGRKHPEAASSCWALAESSGHQISYAPIIRIFEDLVFIWWSHSLPSGKFRLTSIMEWKTGKLLKDDVRDRTGCPRPITRDLVIRQRNFVEGNSAGTTMAIEVQRRRTTSEPQSGSDYTTVARLLLPRLSQQTNLNPSFVHIQINVSETNELQVGTSNRSRRLTSLPSSQIVYLTWGAPGDYYTLATPLSTFTDFQKFLSVDQDVGSPLVIPWGKWGPKCSRLLQVDCGMDQIHGTRLMLLNEAGGVKEILDFNQLDIARDRHRLMLRDQGMSSIDSHIMDKPSTVSNTNFFDEVQTCLPYRTVFRSADRTPSWPLTWILREEIYSFSTTREIDELRSYKYDSVMDS